jgi:hypothetical protein
MSGLAVLTGPRAAEVPDDALLEFLGSVDSEDRNWHDYLARTDIDKVARRTGQPPPQRKSADPPPSDPPPSGSDKPVAQP